MRVATVLGAGLLGRRSTRRVASAVSLSMVAATLVALAITADGSPVTDVDLNDGSVWVTSSSDLMIGRLNPQIKQLDEGVVTGASEQNVLQNGTRVLGDYQSAERSLRTIDVATATAGGPVNLPSTVQTAFGDDTVAIIDQKTGGVWLRSTDTLVGFTTKSTPPDAKVGAGGQVAVSPTGRAFALDRSKGALTELSIGDSGVAETGDTRELGVKLSADTELSIVGDTPVVLDRAGGFVVWPSHDAVKVDGAARAHLQQPSRSGEATYVGTETGLVRIAMGRGSVADVKKSPVSGTPAAPAVLDGCVHGAWASADPTEMSYTRLCAGEDVFEAPVPQVRSDARLVFRINRKVVVLNDVLSGDSWLVQNDTLDRVDNWNDINPDQQKRDQEDKDTKKAERTDKNRPPTAVDDKLGARAGQATILPVTSNDTDPDGDILTVQGATARGNTSMKLAKVGKDTQIQIDLPKDAKGTVEFEYKITDGRGGSDKAVVSVQVRDASQNSEPEAKRESKMTVGRGKTSSTYVMPDWIDPDGDDLVLRDASTKDGGSVEYRADGTVTFLDSGDRTGPKTVNLVMSDGRKETKGSLVVNVAGSKEIPPELIADRAVGMAGTKILVEPLLNDKSPDGTPLRLSRVSGPANVETRLDPDDGTFTATADKAGTYYLDYKASNDSASADSFVRLDVQQDTGQNRAPIAVKDQAVLPPGGSVLVDILNNDYDSDNDVLVVQSVSTPPGSGVKAVLLDKKMLRIETTKDLLQPVTLHYTVSDGYDSAEGTVVVTQGLSGVENRPPVATLDEITVRAGSIATIPVLDNDTDPDGDKLTLYQEDLAENRDKLLLFVSGGTYRVRAPTGAGTYRATYGVRDPGGLKASAEIIVKVLPDTAKGNLPPKPEPIIDRTVSDQKLRVYIQTTGADPDGDAVSFKGVTEAPTLGRIVETGLDWFDYEPFPKKVGTDVFQLKVEDKYGDSGLADVRIGVAPRAAVNQAPVALDDTLLVQPNRTIQYNVLGNDIDPDGDPMRVSGDLEKAADVTASVEAGFVQVDVADAPDANKPVKTTVGYSISDGLGGTDSAFLAVSADEDAPYYAPVTRDDSADLTKIAGKRPGDVVVIDVLKNDGDLDGSKSDLSIKAIDPGSRAVAGDTKLEVTLKKTDQVLAYQVDDADEESGPSYGFVFVSGTDTVPPVVNPDKVPVEVKSAQKIVLPLKKYVLVRAGHAPTLTLSSKVSAVNHDGSRLIVDKSTLEFRSPKGYIGKASVTFEATDGTSLDDTTGLTSLITIPIDVVPVKNVAPTLRSVPLNVERGGEPSKIDLRNLAADANPDDRNRLRFEVTKDAKLVTSSLKSDSSTLEVSAPSSAKLGSTARLEVTVKDPGGASSKATVDVTIVSSTRPTVKVATIEVKGKAGKRTTVDIADYATNPYPGKRLVVSQAVRESGSGSSPVIEGTKISTTPSSSSAGILTIKFTVNDANRDPARAVVGRLKISVAEKPDAPSRPTVSSVESKTVVLTWREPANNGAPITEYAVTGSNGFSKTCPATTCALTGLDNGKDYTFQVAARNVAGLGPRSPASTKASPDELPGIMNAPTVDQSPSSRDHKLTVRWSAPTNEGSAITGYEIHRLGSGETKKVGAGGLSVVWGGLTNGQSYQFEARAINGAEGESTYSPASSPEIPYGKPLAAPAPVASSNDDGGLGRSISVTWSEAPNNGDEVTSYDVTLLTDGAVTRTQRGISGSVRSLPFTVENGHTYSFRVVGHNQAGAGAPSATSNGVNPFGKASAPRSPSLVKDKDHASAISFSAPSDDGGRPISTYEVSSNGGPTVRFSGTSGDVPFSQNNGPYTATITPITINDGTELRGESTTIGGLRPFGTPNQPDGGASAAYRSVNFNISAPAPNGRPVKRVEYEGGGSGSKTVNVNQGGDQACVNARTIAEGENGGEQASGWRTICGNASPRVVSVSNGGASGTQTSCSSNCRWINISVEGFAPGSYTVRAHQDTPDGDFPNTTISVGGDGRGSKNNYYYTGYSGTVHVTIDGVEGTQGF